MGVIVMESPWVFVSLVAVILITFVLVVLCRANAGDKAQSIRESMLGTKDYELVSNFVEKYGDLKSGEQFQNLQTILQRRGQTISTRIQLRSAIK